MEVYESLSDFLKRKKDLLSDIKRNKSGSINGNSFTWWRYKTEQELENRFGFSGVDAAAKTKEISVDFRSKNNMPL